MTDSAKHHLGIDFGTANSFLAVTTGGNLGITPIDFGGDGLKSVVLYRTNGSNDETVVTFGEQAEHEWGMSTAGEKKSLRLASHFKPDITSDKGTPRKDAGTFLKCLVDYLTERGMLPSGRKPSDLHVLVGIPASTVNGYEETLRGIAAFAGLGPIELVKEPIGALVSHLSRKEFTTRDAHGGLLVIDFGGGTCDVAYMLRLEIREAWGDPILGGRLFDDLFFQWFGDENPGCIEAMEREGDTYYVHWIRCREMKERFSETMARDRGASFRYTIPPYGKLLDATWEQFVQRSRGYTPSDRFRDELALFGPSYGKLASAEKIDLLGWVRDVISRGIGEGNIRIEDVSYVILTGGSSAWPFVRELITEELRISPDKIVASASPRRVIGEGIALLPVLKDLHENAVAEIRDERPGKVDEILGEVQRIAHEFLTGLASDLAGEFVAMIEPIMTDFRKAGGRVSDLEKQIEDQGPAMEALVGERVAARFPELVAKTNQAIADILLPWFQSKHIRWDPEKLHITQERPAPVAGPRIPLDDVCMQALTAITSTIMAVVVGTLCGGAGTALLASGPIGWIIGAVLGVAVTLAVAWKGHDYAEKTTKSICIPARLAWLAMRKVNYEKIKSDMTDELLRVFTPELENRQAELRRHIDDLTRAQIDDISALDRL